MRDEQAIEAEIQAKGLNAPRLTPDVISNTIKDIRFHRFEGTTLTVCCLTLRNGYQVTGESAAASPENFDAEIGRNIAFDNARNKIWALEGYLLRQRLADGARHQSLGDSQIKRMVDRFLAWRLPEPWHPDNGISYQRPNYMHTPADHDWPTGTDLFDAQQAEAMIRHMIEGV